MIEHRTIESFSAPSCDVEMSFNRFKVADPTTGNVVQIESLDWRKVQKAVGEFYAIHGSGSTGIEWFKNSVSHWDLDDLETLNRAVSGAIASKKAEAKA